MLVFFKIFPFYFNSENQNTLIHIYLNMSESKNSINRRKFINQAGLASLSVLLMPMSLSACAEDLEELSKFFNGKVVIIGAGAAGLYAGYVLKSRGIDFEIIEASGVIGGRLGKLEGFADYPVDLGAQWLHGNNSIVGDLIRKNKVTITDDESEEFFWFKNEFKTSLPKDLVSIFENEEAPDKSFADYAIEKGFGDEYKYIVEQIAGDQGASAADLSVKWNLLEEENWNSGETDFKFRETFFDLINDYIATEVSDKITLNRVVKAIDYTDSKIKITDIQNNIKLADKVIVTVPIKILQDGDITFTPALPVSKTDAFKKIGMGAGMKVFLKFSSKFYKENVSGGSVCAAYADESIGKSGNDHVLLAFVMGEQAEKLTALGTDTAIVNALLAELDGMYASQATASFISAHVQNWTTMPFVRGAYSYAKVGIGDARKIAAASVDDKLFFAGEAMNLNGHHQTVHGAVETGYREVINIIKSVPR
jgi:monoamine oxidase